MILHSTHLGIAFSTLSFEKKGQKNCAEGPLNNLKKLRFDYRKSRENRGRVDSISACERTHSSWGHIWLVRFCHPDKDNQRRLPRIHTCCSSCLRLRCDSTCARMGQLKAGGCYPEPQGSQMKVVCGTLSPLFYSTFLSKRCNLIQSIKLAYGII